MLTLAPQSQVIETLQRVNLTINRTGAIDGVRAALAAEDYEGAARFVQRFYDLADRTAPEAAPAQTPQAEEQEKVRAEGLGNTGLGASSQIWDMQDGSLLLQQLRAARPRAG